MESFGCDKCWSAESKDAWETITRVPITHYLIDESHYIVSIRYCENCSQHFLQVTTETIDWLDGEDPIYRTIMPITRDEQSSLLANTPPTTQTLEAIGQERTTLKYDWPKGEQAKVYWSTGIRVGRHD